VGGRKVYWLTMAGEWEEGGGRATCRLPVSIQ